MPHDVFISYEKTDFPIAEAICKNLEAGGVSVWYDRRNLVHGADWPDLIIHAINECRVVVLVYSKHTDTSIYVKNEITCATTAKKTIIPFCLTRIEDNNSLRLFLSNSHWLEAFPGPLTLHYKKLLKTIQNYIKPQIYENSAKDRGGAKTFRRTITRFVGGENEKRILPESAWKTIAIFGGAGLVALAALAIFMMASDKADEPPPSEQAVNEGPSPDCTGARPSAKYVYYEDASLAGLEPIGGKPEILCMDTLKLGTKIIKLAGVGAERAHAVKDLSEWISWNGPTIECLPSTPGGASFFCYVGPDHNSIAKHILDQHWAAPQT